MATGKHYVMLATLGLAACQSEKIAATATTSTSTTRDTAERGKDANDVPTATQPSSSRATLQLSGMADRQAIAAVRAEAARQEMTRVTIASTQSFNVTEGGRIVAALVTGRGNLPNTDLNGCFVATRQGSETMLIPTLGYGDYELEPCARPLAVGLLSSSASTAKLGLVFGSYSREGNETVPIVINWDRSNNTLLIDDAMSTKASQVGAQTIAAMKKLL